MSGVKQQYCKTKMGGGTLVRFNEKHKYEHLPISKVFTGKLQKKIYQVKHIMVKCIIHERRTALPIKENKNRGGDEEVDAEKRHPTFDQINYILETLKMGQNEFIS